MYLEEYLLCAAHTCHPQLHHSWTDETVGESLAAAARVSSPLDLVASARMSVMTDNLMSGGICGIVYQLVVRVPYPGLPHQPVILDSHGPNRVALHQVHLVFQLVTVH